MRNLTILFALLTYLAAVVLFALAREWVVVVPLLSVGGAIEAVAHQSIQE